MPEAYLGGAAELLPFGGQRIGQLQAGSLPVHAGHIRLVSAQVVHFYPGIGIAAAGPHFVLGAASLAGTMLLVPEIEADIAGHGIAGEVESACQVVGGVGGIGRGLTHVHRDSPLSAAHHIALGTRTQAVVGIGLAVVPAGPAGQPGGVALQGLLCQQLKAIFKGGGQRYGCIGQVAHHGAEGVVLRVIVCGGGIAHHGYQAVIAQDREIETRNGMFIGGAGIHGLRYGHFLECAAIDAVADIERACICVVEVFHPYPEAGVAAQGAAGERPSAQGCRDGIQRQVAVADGARAAAAVGPALQGIVPEARLTIKGGPHRHIVGAVFGKAAQSMGQCGGRQRGHYLHGRPLLKQNFVTIGAGNGRPVHLDIAFALFRSSGQ